MGFEVTMGAEAGKGPIIKALRNKVVWQLIFCCLVVFLTTCAHANNAHEEVAALQSPPVQRAALQLARQAMTQYLKSGTTLAVPADIPPILRRRFGAFVTIEKRGQITPRGCRGTLQPAYPNLAAEIIRNSIAACIRDIAQPRLRLEELPNCKISITVILRTEPIQSIAQHDPAHNGLIVQSGSRIGIVLPYEGREATTQLRWAKRKAGLSNSAHAQLLELYAVRFRE